MLVTRSRGNKGAHEQIAAVTSVNGKDRPSPRDFKFRFKCMITRLLVNTSGSAKRKTNEVWFLSSAIHPATRIFSNLSRMSRTSASAVHRPPTVPVPICLGNLQWGSTWAGRRASAAGSQLVRSYNCLFRSKAIILRLPSPNSCQLSQKLWKCNIVGISASSSDWIEIDPRVSKLLGGGERGRQWGRQHKSSLSFWQGKKKNTRKARRA